MAGSKYACPGRIREGDQRRRLEAGATAAFTFVASLHRAGSQPTWRKEGALQRGISMVQVKGLLDSKKAFMLKLILPEKRVNYRARRSSIWKSEVTKPNQGVS